MKIYTKSSRSFTCSHFLDELGVGGCYHRQHVPQIAAVQLPHDVLEQVVDRLPEEHWWLCHQRDEYIRQNMDWFLGGVVRVFILCSLGLCLLAFLLGLAKFLVACRHEGNEVLVDHLQLQTGFSFFRVEEAEENNTVVEVKEVDLST